MKTIQMTIDESLLHQVDDVVKTEKTNRSAFIRQALQAALHQYKINQWDKQDQEGYARVPQQLAEVEMWLPEQVWLPEQADDDETW